MLDSEYLKSFGELLVPKAIWRALARFNVWVEPALVAEWIRIMKDYLAGQRRPVAEETFYLATRWSDPERDVRVARELALDLLKRDRLFCVWTGKKLKEIPWTLITAFLGPPGRVETSGIYCRRYDPLIKIRNPMVCRLLNVSPRRKKVSLIGGPPVIRTMRMRSLANAFRQRRRHPYQGS